MSTIFRQRAVLGAGGGGWRMEGQPKGSLDLGAGTECYTDVPILQHPGIYSKSFTKKELRELEKGGTHSFSQKLLG